MDKLPDDVIQQIYFYKHNMEYVNVMNELLQAKINVYYNFSLSQCRVMCFIKDNIKYLSLDESYNAKAKIPFRSFKKSTPFFWYNAKITSQSDSVLKL